MLKTAEKFYYLLDAAGGHSSITPDSHEAEIEDLVGCSKKDFIKALDYLVEKGIVKLDDKGVTLIGKWK